VTTLNLDGRLVSMRLVPIVEDEECSGVLIKLEGEIGGSPEKVDAATL
jgi:hypothetical protein